MALCPANNDLANADALKLARQVDIVELYPSLIKETEKNLEKTIDKVSVNEKLLKKFAIFW